MKWESDLIRDIRTFTDYDDYDDDILPHPSGYGPHYDENGKKVYPEGHLEITDCNRKALLYKFIKRRDDINSILEIGVGRNAKRSFAHIFFEHKKEEATYIGLDIEDRSFLRDVSKNIHTVQNNSSYYSENVQIFKTIGVEQFDFIFIDGWHSINQVLKDWEYTNLLSDGGTVGFHDSTCHPGPKEFIEALDRDKWIVEENCCPDDWGISFVTMKTKN